MHIYKNINWFSYINKILFHYIIIKWHEKNEKTDIHKKCRKEIKRIVMEMNKYKDQYNTLLKRQNKMEKTLEY